MTTMTLTYQLTRGWREPLRSFFRNLLNHHAWIEHDSTPRACDAIAELQRALRTIRLASNPGEDYETVAARIDREAANYRAFLKNPRPIGKIALNIKQLGTEDTEGCSSREQYRVSDPSEGHADRAEGRASVCYTFNRSNDKVLEFIVHDENDQTLFPIARTYSNWLGSKVFDLGLDRSFYLDMVEDAPGYVSVQAGFIPCAENVKKAVSSVQVKPRALAAGAGGSRRSRQNPNSFFTLFGLAPVSLVRVGALALSVFFGLILSNAVADFGRVNKSDVKDNSRSSASALDWTDVAAGDIQAQNAEGEAGVAGVADVDSIAMLSRLDYTRAVDVRKAKRLAGIKSFHISVDNSSCQDSVGPCRTLLTEVQEKMHERLNDLKLPAGTLAETTGDSASVKLIVSYQAVDLQHGNIHLTLSDDHGALWNGDQGFSYEDIQTDSITAYSDLASKEILSEILWARDHVSFDAEVHGVTTSIGE